ncbi:hypothetical protein [Nocardia cyriacigeorgica]|uniref:hypothetical protein n=1 Tax=Nocardia cyriacigeorgica TaxID=135487 RepID=UPI002458F40F|nr:hypothetical protein [Nocardia cyriacigeorgica]
MRLRRREKLDSSQLAEVRAILREARRADVETLSRIAAELRKQTGQPRLQDEIDGVMARYWAAHPERGRSTDGQKSRGPDMDDEPKGWVQWLDGTWGLLYADGFVQDLASRRTEMAAEGCPEGSRAGIRRDAPR